MIEGHDVHVVSTRSATLAASTVIHHQLQMTLLADPTVSRRPRADPTASHPPGTVHLHKYDFYVREKDVDVAVTKLCEAANGGQLHVLVDEASFENK